MKKLKTLIVSDKEHFKVNNKYWSYGGTPKEFNALSTIFRLEVLAPVWECKEVPAGYEHLNHNIIFHTFPRFSYFYAIPSIKNIARSIYLTYRLCKTNNFDVVVCKGPREMGVAAVWGAQAAGVPSILHYSYDWVPYLQIKELSYLRKMFLFSYRQVIWLFRKWFIKMAAKSASLVATVSENFRTHLSNYCKIPLHDITLLRTTFTLTEKYFSVPPIRPTKHKKNILYIGRLDKNKNVDMLLRAAKILEEKRDDTYFIIIGTGPEKNNLFVFTKEIGLKNIEFRGYVSNEQLPDVLAQCYCLVLPSFSEGFPKAILEAQAASRPVIASNVGDVPQIVKDGESGLLFNPYDCDELAEKLNMLLNNAKKAKDMGLVGRENMLKYSHEVALSVWRGVLTEVSR